VNKQHPLIDLNTYFPYTNDIIAAMNLFKSLKRLAKKEIIILIFLITVAISAYFWQLFSINPALRGTFDFDFYHYALPNTWYSQYLFHTAGIPLWDPISANGSPFIAEATLRFFYLPQTLLLLFGPNSIFHTIYTLEVIQILHWYVLCIGTFLFLRKRLNFTFFASAFGGILILFNMFILIESMHGHNTEIDVLCWFPMMLFCFTGLIEQKSLKYFTTSVAVTYAIIASGYIPLAYLSILMTLLYIVYCYFPLLRAKKYKPFILLAFAFILGVGITALILLPQLQFSKHSWRLSASGAYENLKIVSSSPSDILRSIIFPYQFENGIPFYPGMTTVFLTSLYFYHRRFKKNELFFIFLAAAAIIISLGDTLGPLFGPLYYLPTLGILRAPSRLLFFTIFSMAVFSASVLTTYANNRLIAKEANEIVKKIGKYLLLFIAFAVFIILMLRPFIINDVKSLYSDFFLQIIVISISIVAIAFFLRNLKKNSAFIVLIFVLVIDVSLVTNTFIKLAKFTDLQKNMPNLTKINLYSQKYALIPRGFYNFPNRFYDQMVYDSGFKPSVYGNNSLDLFYTNTLMQYASQQISVAQGTTSFEANGKTYSRWWIIGDCQFKQNDEEILSSLATNTVNLQKEILLLSSDFNIMKDYCGNQEISYDLDMLDYKSSSLKLHYSSSQNGVLYLSETYYPGWEATIDGNLVTIIRGNYAFRAIPIPKGDHTVALWFTSDAFNYGVIISIGSVSVFLIFSLIFWKLNKKNK
jgi:hypothetical protein